MNYVAFYEKTMEYLRERAAAHNVSEEELKLYFSPETGNGDLYLCYGGRTVENLFFRFAFHAQNATMIREVIRFPRVQGTPRRLAFEEVLCGFDPAAVIERYHNSEEELFDAFVSKIGGFKIGADYKKSLPYAYSTSLMSAARLLTRAPFNTYDGFVDTLVSYGALAPVFISFEVYRFDIALACDLIKELGIIDLPKPDVHIREVLFELGLIRTRAGTKADYLSIRAIDGIVSEVRTKYPTVTAYEIDKMIWLVSTETFYIHDDVRNSKDTKRKAYLEYIKAYV